MPDHIPRAGVRFQCQGSGNCCVSHGEYGYVYVTLADRRRLAATLGIKTQQFTRRYCIKTEGLFHLDMKNGDCVFLDGKRCAVYDGRPTQCRTWPFWPENMPAKRWAAIAEFCPGIGQGNLIPLDTVREILSEQRRSNAEL
ncbi:MAG: YkgJ family cysteine cluster protein [Gammaproteobacteria bacterium]|nr:YkgJ family cysteine cluster protein [Gammaproteobacteria bacterium]